MCYRRECDGSACDGKNGFVGEDAVERGAADAELAGGAQLVAAVQVEHVLHVAADHFVEREGAAVLDGIVVDCGFASNWHGKITGADDVAVGFQQARFKYAGQLAHVARPGMLQKTSQRAGAQLHRTMLIATADAIEQRLRDGRNVFAAHAQRGNGKTNGGETEGEIGQQQPLAGHLAQRGLRRGNQQNAGGWMVLQMLEHVEQQALAGRRKQVYAIEVCESRQMCGVPFQQPFAGILALEWRAGQGRAAEHVTGQRLFARSGFALDGRKLHVRSGHVGLQQQLAPRVADTGNGPQIARSGFDESGPRGGELRLELHRLLHGFNAPRLLRSPVHCITGVTLLSGAKASDNPSAALCGPVWINPAHGCFIGVHTENMNARYEAKQQPGFGGRIQGRSRQMSGPGECAVKVNFKQTLTMFKLAFQDWSKHNATRLGAALAFYTVWSIAPLVILAVAIASFFFSKSSAQGHLLDQVQALVGYQGRLSVQAMLQHGQDFSAGVWSTIIGLVTLVSGASGVFQELRSDLNDIWEANQTASAGIWGMLREKLFSFGLVLSVGFVLMVSLIASACLAAVSKFMAGLLPLPAWSLAIFNEVVSLIGIAILFAMILKFVPACRVDWRDVRVGAAVTAVLFVIGKTGLGWYLGRSTMASSYGAAGSLVVLVIWVYYSAQIFYYGAEFTHVHAKANRDVLPPEQKAEIEKKAA